MPADKQTDRQPNIRTDTLITAHFRETGTETAKCYDRL